ncbi:MotA/TolQ/ExbB proton channel family protein [Alteromonadaceae bacterium BrNp21-10]|nr:MotA/TolQ/ExbB proton channel family protein [Alteromonadaceae bacterium BrNp21-10]
MKLDVINKWAFFSTSPVIVFILLMMPLSPLLAAERDIERTLIERISKSQTELQNIQQDIARQSSLVAKKLSTQQQSIKALRQKAANLQRLADERLLSLDKLQERVKKWSSQSQYQHQLLSSYAENANLHSSNDSTLPSIDISIVNVAYQDLLNKLHPKWEMANIVTDSGQIKSMDVLKMGPIEVALDNDNQLAGPLIRDIADEPRLQSSVYNENALQQLQSLKANNIGTLTFDPTLGNANKLLKQDKGILSHVETGGVWAIPILIFAALSLVVSLLKAIQLIRLPRIRPLLAEKIAALTVSESQSPAERHQHIAECVQQAHGAQRKLLQIALDTPISQQRDDYLVAYLLEYKHRIEKYLGAIATSAAIAPLLGLLGTVSGMITTFQMMKIFGTGDASTVSGGISEALVTTELGLIVAIPSLIVSALLSRKIKNYHAQLESMAIKLSRIEFPKGES